VSHHPPNNVGHTHTYPEVWDSQQQDVERLFVLGGIVERELQLDVVVEVLDSDVDVRASELEVGDVDLETDGEFRDGDTVDAEDLEAGGIRDGVGNEGAGGLIVGMSIDSDWCVKKK
jgi:hypothetical protein